MIQDKEDIFERALKKRLHKHVSLNHHSDDLSSTPPQWDDLFDSKTLDHVEMNVKSKLLSDVNNRSRVKKGLLSILLASAAVVAAVVISLNLEDINPSQISSEEEGLKDKIGNTVLKDNSNTPEGVTTSFDTLNLEKDPSTIAGNTNNRTVREITTITDSNISKQDIALIRYNKVLKEDDNSELAESNGSNNDKKLEDNSSIDQNEREDVVNSEEEAIDVRDAIRKQNYYLRGDDKTANKGDKKSRNRGFDILASTSLSSITSNGVSTSAQQYYSAPLQTYVYSTNSIRNRIIFYPDEYSHKLPVTASLLLNYGITERIKVGAGVRYTHLLSTAESTNSITHRLIQKVDYIGIPIAINYSYYNSERVRIFSSLGGSAEWIIGNNKEVKSYSGDRQINSESVSERVDGTIFSANIGVGIEYFLGRYFGIFAEPGVDVVFNNKNHPLTYKTAKQVNFNIRVGITINM